MLNKLGVEAGKINLTINDTRVKVSRGSTILEAAREIGIYIPTLCSCPDLPLSLGACRLCIVEVTGAESCFPSSCTTRVTDGISVYTNTRRVQEFRRHMLKALLTPLPSPRLEKPELKRIADYIGVKEEELPPYISRNLPVDREQPLFELDHNRCILCGLCVRICKEVRGVRAIDFHFRDGRWSIGPTYPAESFVDSGCRFCTACVEICPTGALTDKGITITEREDLVPCQKTCPAEIDVPRYVNLINQGRFAEAVAVIREKVPFPAVLGYICLHFCEEKCRRSELNQAIGIRALKRFAAEYDSGLWRKMSKQAPPTGRHIAIVGSGPAGLTAAYYLARLGHKVTVLESLPVIGGMMRVGIPEYRLPKEVLEKEIKEIENAGVEIKTNAEVASVDRLIKEGYDAILLAVGTHKGQKLPIPGADLNGVLVGVDVLRDVNLGKKVEIGRRVAVLGGGNVAFDCARTALRLGAQEVTVACLEAADGMTATSEEIQQAREEGISIHNSRNFTRIVADNGYISGVDCLDVKCFEFDEAGKLSVECIAGSEHIIPADTVIFAIGQVPRLELVEGINDIKTNIKGTLEVSSDNLVTGRAGVFAAGDAVSGPTSVIEAIAMGRKAAGCIDQYLGGSGVIDEELVKLAEPSPYLGPGDGFAKLSRVQMPCLPIELRITPSRPGHFAEVETGYTEEMSIEESGRCLRCNLRLQIRTEAPPPTE